MNLTLSILVISIFIIGTFTCFSCIIVGSRSEQEYRDLEENEKN